MLNIERFGEFYRELHHDYDPFPWQERLAQQAHEQGWPKLIDLPTGFGKTSAIEIALYLTAIGSPAGRRRIFFVVDRRVVVDAASEMAEELAKKLDDAETGILKEVADALRATGQDQDRPPLRAFTLRGGIYRDTAWACDPLQVQICCTTVDQVGSALLFRGYSARSQYSWPIQAAMTAYDSLLLLDEAHLSKPFEQTAQIIQKHYLKSPAMDAGRTMSVVSLTATSGGQEESVFRHDERDTGNAALRRRYDASKSVSLAKWKGTFEDAAAEHAVEFAKKYKRVAVIVNRVDSARAIHETLAKSGEYEAVLFTGRSRPYDRNQLAEKYLPVLRSNSKTILAKPLIAVATQCLEAGADFDFDAMVTEAASWDALRQRWGRLNRMGEKESAPCVVILRGSKTDPIYGDAIKETYDWIESKLPEKQGKKDNPVFDASPANLARVELTGEQLEKMLQPKREAPVLLPAYLDHLVHTSPKPEIEFDIPIFLHGAGSGMADVQVVWREGLNADETEEWADVVSLNPPCSAEMLPLPVWRVRRWLQDVSSEEALTDLEGQPDMEERKSGPGATRPYLLWRGEESAIWQNVKELRPGAVLVLPTEYGGCDRFGWDPNSKLKVSDIGDEAAYELRRRPVLRLFEQPLQEDFEEWLAGHQESAMGRKAILNALRECRRKLVTSEDKNGQTRVVAITGLRRAAAEPKGRQAEIEIEQESDASSFTSDDGVELGAHMDEVGRRAKLFCEKLGVPEELARAVEDAARHHDIGKADPRFQALLRQIPRWAVKPEKCLAKSEKRFASAQAFRRGREQAGYPAGGRHELLSTAMLAKAMAEGARGESDLVLHLVGSHHGRCRPFAPLIADVDPDVAEFARDGVLFRHQTDHALADWGSGVADRFWKLHSEFGWYGVAYLESLLRLADHRVSEEGK